MSAWIVACPGPSLTYAMADQCLGHRVIAVNDAWRVFPFAEALYACDQKWWDNRAPKSFAGEKWTSINETLTPENRDCAARHGLKLINGRDNEGFCFEPGMIHFGTNSGFQAINLVLNEFKATHVIIVGMDMHNAPNGDTHYFGHHRAPLVDPDNTFFQMSLNSFKHAAAQLPAHIRIVNATPGSALTYFPMLDLEDALHEIRHLSAQREVRTA